MSEVRDGPITDHLHSQHDERRDLEGCSICVADMEAAQAEHAWMSRAPGSNPYAPADPQSPQRDWYIDEQGFVKGEA